MTTAPGTTVITAEGPAAGERRGWTTLPKRPGDSISGKSNGLGKNYMDMNPSASSGTPNSTPTKNNGDGKMGYYHVKQVDISNFENYPVI